MSASTTLAARPDGFDTLLLDRTTWDLVVGADGNIAVASPPYALVQDVASAIRLFAAELRYAPLRGIPYFEEVLGHWPTLPVLKAHVERAARTVPAVATARSFVTFASRDRLVGGQVQITTTDNQTLALNEIFVGRAPVAETTPIAIAAARHPVMLPYDPPPPTGRRRG